MEYKKGVQAGGGSQAGGSGQQQQPKVGITNNSSGPDSLVTLPSLPVGQGFYTLESLQGIPSSSSQNLLQSSQQDVYPPGTSYGVYGLMQQQQVIPPEGMITPGPYGLMQQQQQQNMPPDIAMTGGSYGSIQQQGMPYGLMHHQQQQGIPLELSTGPYGSMHADFARTSMHSDPALNQPAHGSYGLVQEGYEIMNTHSESVPGSLLPPRYPIDHRTGHFTPQQVYASWVHGDPHAQFQQPVRFSSSVPPCGPINSSFPDPVRSREGAIEGLQDGQRPLKRESVREYVGQPLSYRGLGPPSRSEKSFQQGWKPGRNDTVKMMVSPFKGIPGVLTPKKHITVKTSKQHEPTGGLGGPGWCSVCQIDCNTKDVLEQHKAGKKHKKHLQKQELQVPSGDHRNLNEKHMKQFENLEEGSGVQEKDLKVVKASSLMVLVNGLGDTPNDQDELAMKLQAGQQQLTGKEEQPDGKQNLGGKAQPAGCESNLAKRKQKVKGAADDIACKRQKLLDVGTSIEAVKVCSLCSVVCNSQTVFNSHLSGKKHAAQLKKSVEVGNPVSVAKNDAKKPAAGVKVGVKEDMNAD